MEVDGALESIPDSIRSAVFAGEAGDLEELFYPFYLRSCDFRHNGYFFIALGIAALSGFCYLGFRPFIAFVSPMKAKEIRQLGNDELVEKLSLLLDQELSVPTFSQTGFKATDTFVVLSQPFAFHVSLWSDLLWAYKVETTQRVLFIPLRISQQTILVFRNFTFTIMNSEEETDRLLVLAVSKSPWAIFGYSDDIAAIAEKQRHVLEQVVEQAHADFIAQAEG